MADYSFHRRDPGNHVEIPHIQNQKTKSGEDGYSDDDVDVEQDENKDPYTDQAGHQWQVAHQLGKGAFGTVSNLNCVIILMLTKRPGRALGGERRARQRSGGKSSGHY